MIHREKVPKLNLTYSSHKYFSSCINQQHPILNSTSFSRLFFSAWPWVGSASE